MFALIIIAGVLFILYMWWALSNSNTSSTPYKSRHVDFDTLISELQSKFVEKISCKHFDLFGTKAAFLWKDDDFILVLCITAFHKCNPISQRYDCFRFNLKEFKWEGNYPRGVSNKIREEIIANFKVDKKIRGRIPSPLYDKWLGRDLENRFGKDIVIKIGYESSSGENTTRVVQVYEFDGIWIRCFCRTRHEVRTFTLERIKYCEDANTGQEIKDLASYLNHAGDKARNMKRDAI